MTEIIACHECDLLYRRRPLPAKGVARCARCGAVLYRHKPNSLNRTLAWAISGLILFVIANVYPFLALRIEGQVQQAILITGVKELYFQGMKSLAAVVFLTSIFMPFLQLSGLLYVLLPLKFNLKPPFLGRVFRVIRSLQPWSMMEVFMLGILVSIVKLAKMATIIPGLAIYAFLFLIFVLAAATVSLDPDMVWEKVPIER